MSIPIAIALKGFLIIGFGCLLYQGLIAPQNRKLVRHWSVLTAAAYPIMLILPSVWLYFGLLVFSIPLLSRRGISPPALYVVLSLAIAPLKTYVTAGSMQIAPIAAASCLAISLLLTPRRQVSQLTRRFRKSDLPFVAYATVVIFSSVHGLSGTVLAREFIDKVLSLVLPYVALRRTVVSDRDVKQVMISISYSAFVQSIIALYESQVFWSLYTQVPTHYHVDIGTAAEVKIRGGLMRAHGSLAEPTSFAWVVAAGLIVTYVTRTQFRNTGAWLFTLMICAAGIYASGSRVGWVAAALGLIAYDFFRGRHSIALAKGFGAYLIYSLAPLALSTVGKTTKFSSEEAAGTLEYRQRLWHRGMEEITKHPVFGISMSDVQKSMSDMIQGEGIIDFVNAYILYGVTTGLIGVALLIFYFFEADLVSWRLRRLPPSSVGYQLGAIVFSIFVMSSITAFTSGYTALPFIFALLACIAPASISLRLQNHKGSRTLSM